ncbi:MAG: hypothetical protein IPG50_17265 [Myxococcales bacterium]|nr:hypothetical protein [Myxococcales bacterium]
MERRRQEPKRRAVLSVGHLLHDDGVVAAEQFIGVLLSRIVTGLFCGGPLFAQRLDDTPRSREVRLH